MPNVSNPLVPVTDSLYSNFFITLRSLASSFLPSHLWYRPGQWGLPHRSSVFYLLRLSRTTVATHPLNFRSPSRRQLPLASPPLSPHLIGYRAAGPAPSPPGIPAAVRQSK